MLYKIKPHGSAYGMTARDIHLARAVTEVAKAFNVGIVGLAGTCHQKAAAELNVPFIAGTNPYSNNKYFPRHVLLLTSVAEYFADLDYSAEGKLQITR